ncbi:ABC transporter permease [Isoptericola sp. NPDC019482]|uniref:ABC transporter permease n=1 Tax=Isoptericola sp. NPDC019482 TaxID=3154688 RepID=UPI003469A9B4
MTALSDTATLFDRDVRAKLRTPWPYVESLADPLLLLLLFAPLAGAVGAAPAGASGSTMQWFVPGMLVIMTFSTSAFIGSGIQEERAAGSLERLLVTPTHRTAILTGRVLRVMATVLVQALVIVAVTAPMGLRVPAAGALLAAVELAALAAGLALLSLAAGVGLRNAYAFWGVVTLVYTPLIVTSGALLPMHLAPDWLYALSRVNPMAHTVDAQRALFAGDLTDPSIGLGLAVSVGMAALGLVLGVRAMGRLRA